MNQQYDCSHTLAASITKAASKQTYHTIQFLVDRDLVADAYKAYGYFRWVDDILDAPEGSLARKVAFIQRQRSLLEAFYHRAQDAPICPEEQILADLVRSDAEVNSGLQIYLRNMMDVMSFDVARRWRVICRAELDGYTRNLAVAVTEAMYYFIGHSDSSPAGDHRYLAVTAAHITHMLRDTIEDVRNGYFNIPGEYLRERGITAQQVDSPAYRDWVCGRIQLAR